MKNLVLEGGGVKGIAYAGVFSALSSQNQLNQIENVLGVSAGAIAAVFLALGMTSNEIEQALRSIDYTEFKDDSFGALRDTYRFVSKYGKHKGDFFEHWLAGIVEAYTGNRHCTFAELANAENSKNLYIAATCLDLGTQVVFSKETHPSMSIVTACRASMSIPFVFVPVELEGHLYIDGGVLNNYPINFFDRKGGDTIGIKLETSEEIKGEHIYKHNNVLQYSINIFNVIYDSLQTKHISKRDWAKTIIVDCGSISAMDFKLKDKDKDALIQSGWKATLEFLTK
jgi:NTE family protein